MASRKFYEKAAPENDNLATPRGLAAMLVERYRLELDVAATARTCVVPPGPEGGRPVFFGPEDDGLAQRWSPRRCWMNPPYSQIGHWAAKAHKESDDGALVVGLLPAWTDRKWFHEHVLNRADVVFIQGRLRFLDPKSMEPMPWGARFASMVCIWNPLRHDSILVAP